MRGAAKLALMERMADEEAAASLKARVKAKTQRKAAKLNRKLKKKGLVK